MPTAVLATLDRIEVEADRGKTPSYSDGAAALETGWSAVGPIGHPHEAILPRANDDLVEQVAGGAGATRHRGARWGVAVGTGAVGVVPRRVVEQPWGAVTVQILGAHRHDLS